MIRFEQFGFTYENSGLGVKDIDLTVQPGELIVLTGPSGCGKTTLTRCINGLIPDFYEGTITGCCTVCGMDITQQETGDFSAKDIAVSGHFSYMLGSRIAGGIAARFITSYIGNYNSLAMGGDLGLNYYDPDTEWSVSAVARNLGGQLKAYDDNFESMPVDLQVGASKKFENMPFRLSATLVDLNHWNYSFINHLVLGVDAVISESIWIGGGYNFRRAHDMKIETADGKSSHGAGLSFGAGLNLSRIKINLAYGKYHVSSSSVVVNAAFNL